MNVRRTTVVLAVIATLVIAVLGTWFLFTHNARVSFSYCVEAQFTIMPVDDERLAAWLKDQPGIVPHTVLVRRFGSDSKELEVGFIQVRTLAGSPQFPKLDEKCAALGYEHPKNRFMDCKNRYR